MEIWLEYMIDSFCLSRCPTCSSIHMKASGPSTSTAPSVGAEVDGDGASELPIAAPLSHAPFLVEPFHASTFLLTRKHVNLDDLRSELRAYLASLRQQLVSIINSDYEDFINLGGSHLLGSDDQMGYRMRKPLEGISREVKEARSELQELRARLGSRLEKRDDVRTRKAMCRKLLGINEQIQKVEEMLLISTAVFATVGEAALSAGDEAMKAGLKAAAHGTRRVSSLTKKVDRYGKYDF